MRIILGSALFIFLLACNNSGKKKNNVVETGNRLFDVDTFYTGPGEAGKRYWDTPAALKPHFDSTMCFYIVPIEINSNEYKQFFVSDPSK